MDRVYGFMTKDNKFFLSEKEALQHEALLDFINWYERNNELKVNPKQLAQWLINNKDNLIPLLQEVTDGD